jgi:two-component system chemotaxis response regulator CheB
MTMAGKIKVLIIDDSALIREFLRETLSADPDLDVIGTAADPYFARDKVVKLRPDVITLDIEMPRMDGLTFLDKLMAAYPTPVVMFSSHTLSGAKATLEALARGAVDFVAKPTTNLAASLPGLKAELVEKVKTAALAKVERKIGRASCRERVS